MCGFFFVIVEVDGILFRCNLYVRFNNNNNSNINSNLVLFM